MLSDPHTYSAQEILPLALTLHNFLCRVAPVISPAVVGGLGEAEFEEDVVSLAREGVLLEDVCGGAEVVLRGEV